jgi:hypothetical protein
MPASKSSFGVEAFVVNDGDVRVVAGVTPVSAVVVAAESVHALGAMPVTAMTEREGFATAVLAVARYLSVADADALQSTHSLEQMRLAASEWYVPICWNVPPPLRVIVIVTEPQTAFWNVL